ncbi:MAG: 16S rRNA (cytosine(1402)-N(4))-methyltransferase RsmH, partial [Oscillospiraceae bacterium]|nr:16S rRNA (cytosine(1402)-N(4))-methyltransferase RsmH [Oscillospiraceae bacterium]
MKDFHHISVLLEECLEGLNIKPEGIYVDGTLGGAGHSSHIVQRLTTGRLIGIDRDPVALEASGKRLEPYKDRVTLVHSNFCEMKQVMEDLGITGVDGILLDLGVSSPQLDDGERGFSYMTDAPLDMRMNSQDKLSAYEVVNTWSQEELKRILFEYGEERYA